MKFKKYNYILLLIALAICGIVLIKNKNAAESVIASFHRFYNNGDYDKIWSEVYARLPEDSARNRHIKYLQSVRATYGTMDSSSRMGKKEVNMGSWTRKIEIEQKSFFEKGEGIETFTIEFKKPKAVLLNYNIR